MTEKINSGIYQLSFRDGTFYIGKSINLIEREMQHRMLLLRNRGSEALQAAYKKNGLFFFEVIVNCHPDWLDIAEAHYINVNQPPLNSVVPELRMDVYLFDSIVTGAEPWILKSIQSLYIDSRVKSELLASMTRENKILTDTIKTLESKRTEEDIKIQCGKDLHELQDKYYRDIKELNERLEEAYKKCEPWYIRWFRKIRP